MLYLILEKKIEKKLLECIYFCRRQTFGIFAACIASVWIGLLSDLYKETNHKTHLAKRVHFVILYLLFFGVLKSLFMTNKE